MPRYRFHLRDGKRTVPDYWGSNFPHDKAAIAEARQAVRDLRDAPPDEDWTHWVIEVVDETGRCVITLRASDVDFRS